MRWLLANIRLPEEEAQDEIHRAVSAGRSRLWPSSFNVHAQPVRIGSTLALTGPLAPAGNIQKVAIETFIEDLNGRGGLLGRKVEWVLKDDQSRPDLARTLYEQLATVDKVDLLMGPTAPPRSSRRWASPSATTRS